MKGFSTFFDKARNSWTVSFKVGNTRKKRSFATKVAAEEFARSESKARLALRFHRDPMDEDRINAAIEITGNAKTLLDVATAWSRNPVRKVGSTIKDVGWVFWDKVASREWNQTHYNTMRSHYARVIKDWGSRDIGEPTALELRDYLLGVRDQLSHASMNKTRYMLNCVFGHAALHGVRADNPMKSLPTIKKRSEDFADIEFFTAEEMEALLASCQKLDEALIPRFVLGTFGGIRPEEILHEHSGVARLPDSCVDLKARTIRIPASIAKHAGGKPRPRIVEGMPDTLWSWLEKYWHHGISATSGRKRRVKVMAHAGITKGFHSILRHSYATMACPILGEVEVARQLGHKGTQILHDHYRGIVSRADAADYFQVKP